MKKFLISRRIIIVALLLLGVAMSPAALFAEDEVKFKGVPSPGDYGSIVLNNKTGEGTSMPEVVFPHWWHRSQFTCKVCHTDLEFPMKAGETDFVMGDIFAGKQCGACHNGNTAFAPTDCNRCHSMGQVVEQNRDIEEVFKDLPKDPYGNRVDWVKALRNKDIKPKASIDGSLKMNVLDLDVVIKARFFRPRPPDVRYPHKAHTEWLDCTTCHPSIFNMVAEEGAKDGRRNPDMTMMEIIDGNYCGVCHGKVAFPLENCIRCHSEPVDDPYMLDRPENIKKKKKRLEESDLYN